MAGQEHFTATLSDPGVGGFTHPFLSSNHIVVAVGFCVLATGYAASASSS
jgi:hypothetical protein